MHNLKNFHVILVTNFNTCIVNIKRFYATNQSKVSIIIWQPTVNEIDFCAKVAGHLFLTIHIKASNL